MNGMTIAGIVCLCIAVFFFLASRFIFHPIFTKLLKAGSMVLGALGFIYLIVGLTKKSSFTNVEEKDLKK
jgi:hypothetical protein